MQEDNRLALLGLIPSGYKLNTMLFFFNNPDSEKIRNIVKVKASEFINVAGKKMQFSVGVRLYALPHEVCSVRLILIRIDLDEFMLKTDKNSARNKEQNKK